MPTIISAKDYGYRKVIRVCLNPDAPQYVHTDHSPHPARNVNGCQRDDCHYNWTIRGFVWTQDEMYTESPTGKQRLKTNDQLLKEIKDFLEPATAPSDIRNLAGVTING